MSENLSGDDYAKKNMFLKEERWKLLGGAESIILQSCVGSYANRNMQKKKSAWCKVEVK